MSSQNNIEINTTLEDSNKLKVSCSSPGELYAFQLFCDDKMVDRVLYSEEKETLFWLFQSGIYTVRVCVKEGNSSSASFSDPIEFANTAIHTPPAISKTPGLWKRVAFILKELGGNFVVMCRLARYDYKLLNKDSYLGKLWSILTPLIQIATYWLVFGIGIRSGNNVDGHPFLLWMLCGLTPWFFINEGITKGANSIYSKAGVVTKMKYPVATVPVQTIMTALMEHIVIFLILLVTLVAMGYYPTWHYLNLIYYIIYEFVFLSSLAMVTSVLTMLARDFQKLLNSITRLLFYLTPILWSMDRMPKQYQDLLQFSPILYAVTGFRDSLLYEIDFWEHPYKILFFWFINLALLILGCNMQYKYRKKYSDLF